MTLYLKTVLSSFLLALGVVFQAISMITDWAATNAIYYGIGFGTKYTMKMVDSLHGKDN